MLCPSCSDSNDFAEMVLISNTNAWSGETNTTATCICCGYSETVHFDSATTFV